ncbi:hypothetical protein BT93_L5277 [Corymbia citriodora subsp. variegata]|uniref:Vacuolar membrane PQ loop repeat protein n=1 Tax=Corymbia citriodora subsp. variegata TaxID=360336 RepID=A0A8T0CG61_CORYI|nr:hypothetical protein BT93_L5277 [Corymbia citriodora subsp. variegata]
MLVPTVQFLVSTAHNGTHHDHTPLSAHEALSGLFGSVSLACWLFLLLPQLLENYRNQSAEAISLAFVFVWFLGDLCNLLGALWAGLVPVVIAIAVYFCISDGLLISQCMYYGIRNRRREGDSLLQGFSGTIRQDDTINEQDVERSNSASQAKDIVSNSSRSNLDAMTDLDTTPTETEPLLSRAHSRSASTGKYTIPGSVDLRYFRAQAAAERARRESAASTSSNVDIRPLRRKSSSAAAISAQSEPLAKIFEDRESASSLKPGLSPLARLAKDFAFILLVIGVGCIGWLIAFKTGTWQPTPPPSTNPPHDHIPESENPTSAQFLGYASAVLYLTARLPQIYKNYNERSCEGLSILFFVLSLIGNATYGGGILAHSLQGEYVRKNLPWLIGSLGTIFEDMIVFVQFRVYRHNTEVIEETPILSGPPDRERG